MVPRASTSKLALDSWDEAQVLATRLSPQDFSHDVDSDMPSEVMGQKKRGQLGKVATK